MPEEAAPAPQPISIHALREEGDSHQRRQDMDKEISIHALREEGDHHSLTGGTTMADFYPRPPRGGRRGGQVPRSQQKDFYPRPPRGGRRRLLGQRFRLKLFLSTPSARRATLAGPQAGQGRRISIHALREEGDQPALPPRSCGSYFYPRPPRGGRPPMWCCRPCPRRFLSTPSARRATLLRVKSSKSSSYFYPRPPRGGRPTTANFVEGAGKFLSTPSARRATRAAAAQQAGLFISIHALREEGDRRSCICCDQ